MTPAAELVVPTGPPPQAGQSVSPRLSRPPRRLLAAGACAGLAAAWCLDGNPLGLGFVVLMAVWAAGLLRLGGREGWEVARGQRWLLAASLACAAFVAVRDSEVLVGLDALASLGLALLAAFAWTGDEPVADVTLGGLVWRPMAATGQALVAGATVVTESHHGSRLGTRLQGAIGPALRTLFIAGPVVALVTGLLAAGDASFGERLSRVAATFSNLPLPEVVRMSFMMVMVTPIAAGLTAFALRRRQPVAPAATRPFRLGMAESFGLVGGLAAVALIYGANLAECALSPDACVLPTGYTYAAYAHEGFAQLMVAAFLTLMVLIAVPPRAELATPARRSAFRLAATVLVLATLPMLASAFRRLGLYEATYGFTEQRVWAQACSLLVGLMLAWRGVTLWTWPWRFGVGALGSAVLVLLAMNLLNPDAFIARENLARPEGVVQLDSAYLSSLSADAAEVLAQAGIQVQRPMRDGVASFNLARARAKALPAQLRAPEEATDGLAVPSE